MLCQKLGHKIEIKKLRLMLIAMIIAITAGYIVNVYSISDQNEDILKYTNVPISLVVLYSFLYIAGNLTQNFRHYDKKGEPRIRDYIITVFLLAAFPFGTMWMHSHLRLILKENGVIKQV